MKGMEDEIWQTGGKWGLMARNQASIGTEDGAHLVH